MYQKIGLKVATSYSPNFNLPKRVKNRIKFIIIHYTGMKKESVAINRLQDPKSKVSSHYLIKRNGEIINLVPDLFEAWHAGVDFRAKNYDSIENLEKNSLDFYASVKSLYLQDRQQKILNSRKIINTQDDSDWEEISQ